jgi:ketosteroid isomerase-like protein
MSSANLELVRSICAAWDRGDYSSVGWAHPEIEFVVGDGPSPGRWSRLTGMAESWREWLGAWEEFSQEADEYRELDDECVLVFFRMRGRGRTSGLDLAQMHPLNAGLFHVREGKVTKFVGYLDHERALADVGLAPEAGQQHPDPTASS